LGCRYLRLPRAPQPDKSPLGPKTCSSTRGTSQGQGRLSRVRATFPGPDDVRPRSPRVGGADARPLLRHLTEEAHLNPRRRTSTREGAPQPEKVALDSAYFLGLGGTFTGLV